MIQHQPVVIFPEARVVLPTDLQHIHGQARVGLAFTFVAAAYNLVRLPRLLGGGA